ncbi:alcohol dehydrogenase AdhP [Auritidibacter ignavus]|uniref:Alcohol dehydrogenase n=1 Tax=Auritidibacter ignavus TaxID=678932 RepID=A0AAJ6AIE9_9MICC|nr:alcohol dehydrogenase AdhP [Auritidibacter ignavus]WGH83246.1 alcohol dehydrogenase AdhP [Auritidibacter ignavus]WGH92612.1 alcohol dehydrogenase AdhP [Auritidibacter ignavus]WHS29011.1 alcohol dehydrogenase AdhP [Auritidibacter ignavus]
MTPPTPLASTMKAAVVTQFGDDLTVKDAGVPTPTGHQALVKLISSGVCHTDLHAAEGDWPVKPSPPFIPGHEGVGVVEALGDQVTNVSIGDLVGNAWLYSACGHCEHCRTGWETLCEEQDNGGYTVDGSFGEYMLVDTRYAAMIPAGADPYEVAPVLCAGVTVYKGLKRSEVQPGQWVVISGIGGLGHIAVQYAVAMGMRVAAVDIADDKLALARQHGAELTVNANVADPSIEIQQTIGGAHGVLVTAVHPDAFGQAINMARRGGTIVFHGLPPGEFPAPIFDIVLKGLTIRGSVVGTRQDMVEALEFYAAGKIHPTFHRRPLAEINEIFDEMRHGKIEGRVVIEY